MIQSLLKHGYNMSYIVVDVEADGELVGHHSIVCFGAVVVEPSLSKTFYGKIKPIGLEYNSKALGISGFSRSEHEAFDDPETVMLNFEKWILNNSKGKPMFISDNPAFDWQWINWYFHRFLTRNIFGFSARRIGDLYCGMKLDASLNSEWKKLLRKTTHDHNPVNDAKGNAEAILAMQKMGLKIELV